MYQTKKTIATVIIILLAFIALGSVYYTFNEAKKLAQDQARQDKADAELKKAKDNFDLENKRLKEIRAKSYLIKISKEQYIKAKDLVDQTNLFFKNANTLNPEIILTTRNKTVEAEINAKRIKINLLLQTWNNNNENSIETNQELIDQIKTVVLFIQAYMSQLQTIISDLPANNSDLTTEEINSYHQIINSGMSQIIEVMTVINQTETIINDPTNPLNGDMAEITEQINNVRKAEDRVTELENVADENNNQNPYASTTNSVISTSTTASSTKNASTTASKRPRIVNPEPLIIYQINPNPYKDTGVDVDNSGKLNSLQDW